LYFSNQNHRFVHGAAQAGFGRLSDDWLAGTADPTPLFSRLVEWTYRWGHESLFYGYYVAVMAVYVSSLTGIARSLIDTSQSSNQLLVFAALFIFVHSLLVTEQLSQPFASEVGNFLHTGLAGQYLLGPMFQPSAVGVFLILSVRFFVDGRPYAAVLASSLAATAHSTYLLSAAVLTLCYLACLVRDRQYRTAAKMGGLSVLTVVPVVVYGLMVFGPSSVEAFSLANSIMAHERFPHHTEIERWFDDSAVAQIALVCAAIVLLSTSRLGTILAVALVSSITLTLAQVLLASDSLALLFPWRTSVWLVPISMTVLLSYGVSFLFVASGWVRVPRSWLAVGATALILASAGYGARQMAVWHSTLPNEADLFGFVRSNLRTGQVWLIPIHLQTFRLATGAPIFVDYKSHPYKDVEVLEWKQRLGMARECYDGLLAGDHGPLSNLAARAGVTHIVTQQPLSGEVVELLYVDRCYQVYRVRPRSPGPGTR
jgi:hypothetical protein